MKIVFISNFYNHHQAPFCEEMFRLTNGDFCFIATKDMPIEQKKLGYPEEFPSFVKQYYKNNDLQTQCHDIIYSADVVIIGAAPYFMVSKRIKSGKLTFVYSERRYKISVEWYKKLVHVYREWKKYGKYNNVYMLCASAYASSDEKSIHSFVDKCYKWGYFPKVKKHKDINELINKKDKKSLLWVARFLEWKHPEVAINVVNILKQNGYTVNLSIIGSGPEKENIENLIKKYNLQNEVYMLGSMSTDDVRLKMENSEIFLFTSDKNEGWGAVLNESMNSGCAVVASHAIGSVPFLIKDGENGMIYKDGDVNDLFLKVKWLLDHKNERESIARKAYETMVNVWNAENAAKSFIQLVEALNKKIETPIHFGPCSKAEIIYDNWK